MGLAARNNQGASGRYIYKNWTHQNDGQRLGAVPATLSENPPDLINSCYRNANGSRTLFAISIDLDASRARSEWKKDDGSLNWAEMEPRFQEALPGVVQYLAYVTKSSGGLGLSLVFGIKPLPLIDSTFANQQMYNLSQAYLIKAFSRLGFGADPAAVGLTRDFPNFKNEERNLVSRPEVFRWLEKSLDESHFRVILSASVNFLRSEERKERLYPDARVEGRLATLFHYLLHAEDPSICTLEELKKETELSQPFLRKLLKKPPSWLLVTSQGHGKGWALSLNRGDPFLDLRRSRAESLLKGQSFRASVVNTDVFGLCLPEEVKDGSRNEWLHQVALFYKWAGMKEFDCLRKIELRMRFIPEIERSRNGKNIGNIVRSIYRNHPGHFGKYADLGLPEWMVDDDLYAGRVRSGLRLVVDPPKDDSGEVVRDRSSEFSAEDHGKFSLFGAEIDDLRNHSDGWNQMRSPEFALGASLVEVDTKTPVEGQESKIGGVLPSVETLVEGGELRETKSVTSSICFEATLSRSQNVLSLQKGCNPIGAYCGPWLQRLVGDDAHFTYRGVRYSVSHNLVGECLGIYCDKNSQKLMIFHGQKLIETHDLLKNFSGRVTKLEHRFYPLKRKVRSDGHVLFHGKLYSTGDSYLGRTVFISHDEDYVTIRDFDGKIVAVHDSIQEDFRRTSTLSDHFGPWKKALDHHSYYREMARKIGPAAEEFVVGVLNKKKGLIDSSLIFRFFRLAKKHDRDIFLSLCREQVDKRDFRLKPLVAMLDWLDG